MGDWGCPCGTGFGAEVLRTVRAIPSSYLEYYYFRDQKLSKLRGEYISMKKFVLGVDGGNTKTQYCLYTAEGGFVDAMRAPTCSHEQMADGFVGCKRVMNKQIAEFLGRNKITPNDLAYSVFGLAGADFEWQKQRLTQILNEIGFVDLVVDNDGYLAIKAGSEDWTGVCNINGTGTVTVGINSKGDRLQVGGIGDISSDYGGGEQLARAAARAVYDSLYRCGEATALEGMIFGAFGIESPELYAQAILEILGNADNVLRINRMIGAADNAGDKVANGILRTMGGTLGMSAAGCLNALGFEKAATVVLAGSVWVKGDYSAMKLEFERVIKKHCPTLKTITLVTLDNEPAIGAVLWALEKAGRLDKAVHKKVISNAI